MTIFFKGEYDPKEHAELFDELYGKIPENEVDLVQGVDDDAVKFEKEAEKKEEE